jgi:predicted MPP superfamily phosphohydrolase
MLKWFIGFILLWALSLTYLLWFYKKQKPILKGWQAFLLFMQVLFLVFMTTRYMLRKWNGTVLTLPYYMQALLFFVPFALIIYALFFFFIRQNQKYPKQVQSENEKTITRLNFLETLAVSASAVPLATSLFGLKNAHNYQIINLQVPILDLPMALRGLKILQISDIHAGSFWDKQAVEKGIDLILAQNADIICFTGDLVNDYATEILPYKDLFARLHAPLGVFSSLGNHDYGDYGSFASDDSKAENLQNLKSWQADMGWDLLCNENRTLTHQNQAFTLIGVENWGMHGFAQYGNLQKALENVPASGFKLLLSHDPSHWRAEVLQQTNIQLTLAGHTHGMQMGIETPYLKFSPVQWRYPEWAGLYEDNSQYLHVNRGFGYIGYPGRIGILPEITVLELV